MQIIEFIFFVFCTYSLILFGLGFYYGAKVYKIQKQKAWLESLFLQSPTK
jgi:hypothetical protein